MKNHLFFALISFAKFVAGLKYLSFDTYNDPFNVEADETRKTVGLDGR